MLRRSIWKGSFVDAFPLRMKKKTDPLLNRKIWSRRSSILPEFVNCSVRIYNGKSFVRCKITEGKVGHKFGEFAFTRKRSEDFQETILKREEKRRKSQNKAHMARKGNPISVEMRMRIVLGRIALLLLCIVFITGLCLVLGLECQQFLERLQSMLLGRGVRCLFSRLLGWEVPLFLLDCIVGSVVGSSLHMMDPAGGQPAANPAAEQPSNGSSGASTSGLRSFEERVLLEPMPPSGEGRDGHHGSSNPSDEGGGTHHSSSNPSVNQPAEQAVPPANPLASGEAEAGPSHVAPFPYHEEEVIGGDSVLSIRSRLLAHNPNPSAEDIYLAEIDAQDRFEVKADIAIEMSAHDPTGDWVNRGARALDNPRTLTGEESLEKLYIIREKLRQRDWETINNLKEKMVYRGGS